MTHTEAIAIRSAQLAGQPVTDDDAQVALLVIALAVPATMPGRRTRGMPRKARVGKL